MHRISVEIVYATPEKQWLAEYDVIRGTSAQELIEKSEYLSQIPALKEVDINDLIIGVYAKKVTLDYLLEEGDRLEVYRALTADPKTVRRQLAMLGETIGKSTAKKAQ